ncbi:MAG TPA: dihydrofolate reductase family protein [Acidimicrobiales bacterium]|nr:dihydrofolate reductase family protein [Acidimicrobiales bacterium]
MGKLIYSANMSLDGYIEDASGSFDWSVPDDEVHQFFNDLLRPIGTHLLGRRMYETMAVWETDPSLAEQSAVMAEFAALWQDGDKVVYSTTLTEPRTARTRIVRAFDADEVRSLKQASSADFLVSGPGLAAHAMRAAVVDEIHMVIAPVTVGGGKPAFPPDVRLDLELLDQRRFRNGAVHLAYQVRP